MKKNMSVTGPDVNYNVTLGEPLESETTQTGTGKISGIAITKKHIHISMDGMDGAFKMDFTEEQARKIFDLFINDTPVDFEAGIYKK